MLTSLLASLVAGLGVCPPGEAPGTVVVVGGDLQPVTFSLPTGIDYQLSYDAARLALWFDPARTLPAMPLTTFQTPAQIVHGDLTADARINGADIQTFIDVLLGVNFDPNLIAQADFDDSGAADLSDMPLFVSALLAAGPLQNTVIILYADGLTASTDLCDTPVDLLTDPQGTGTFALADTAQVTVADLTISPQTGNLGTPVTITLTPAIAPLAFDAATTASWTGVFQPMVGAPTASFTIDYSASQFRESSASQGVIILGDGALQNLPSTSGLSQPGSFDGVLSLNLSGLELSNNAAFTPSGGPILNVILYDQNAQPFIGPTPDSLEIVVTTNGDGADEGILAGMVGNLLVAFLEIERNSVTDT